jgi:mannitol-1-/sugar-/sorbitol-6-phosphatase
MGAVTGRLTNRPAAPGEALIAGDRPIAPALHQRQYSAILFDCDGVLVDSRSACRATWIEWAGRVEISDLSVIEKLEGRPTRDAMSGLVPDQMLDGEVAWFEATELRSAHTVQASPGARRALGGLPSRQWAVVTSASRVLAQARLAGAGLPIPDVLVCADDVKVGKPNPECYRMAAARLGVGIDRCLAIEDSVAGAYAANAAGASVAGVGPLLNGAHVHIGPLPDLRSIELCAIDGRTIQLTVIGC